MREVSLGVNYVHIALTLVRMSCGRHTIGLRKAIGPWSRSASSQAASITLMRALSTWCALEIPKSVGPSLSKEGIGRAFSLKKVSTILVLLMMASANLTSFDEVIVRNAVIPLFLSFCFVNAPRG